MSRILADAVLVLHLAFVAWVVAGGLVVLRWRRAAWLHLPAVAWGALVELAGWVCPLTPLEMTLRRAAGDPYHHDSFVAEHLLPVLYPGDLTRPVQIVLGLAVLALNGAIYARVWLSGPSAPGSPGRPRG